MLYAEPDFIRAADLFARGFTPPNRLPSSPRFGHILAHLRQRQESGEITHA